MTPDDIITDILNREGGTYTDAAADRGGPTKWGITLATLQEVRPGATANDVRLLSETDARALYATLYVQKPGFDQIANIELRALVVDSGVLHGSGRAAMWLQQAVGVKADGALGPATLAAIGAADPVKLYEAVLAARLCFVGNLISHDHSQAVFAGGWLARLAEFVEA